MARMPRPRTMFERNRASGFTLVELAMASFLVAVGLLAVFALLRRGIDTEGFSGEEIRETLFAETAFATIRAAADHAAATDTWTSFWEDFESCKTNLPLPGAFRDAQASIGDDDPSPFLFGGPAKEWRAALFSGWPMADESIFAVSNTVWYCMDTSYDDSYARVQIHLRADRPRETSRTAFTIIPNQTGRAFREANRGKDSTGTPVGDD